MNNQAKFGIGALALVFLAGVGISLWLNSALKKERAIVSHYQAELSEVYNQRDAVKQQRDSLQIELDFYMALVDSLDVLVETNENQIAELNKALKKASDEIAKWTPTDAYNFLQSKYMTNDPDYVYPFSGKQVKLIAEDVTVCKYKDSLLLEQADNLRLLEGKMSYQDIIIDGLADQNADLQDTVNTLLDNMEAMIKESEMSAKEIARLKKALRMWQTGSITAGGLLVLILLLV